MDHKTGFKIELLNDQGYQDIDFTPQGFVGSENTEVTFIIQGISWQSEQKLLSSAEPNYFVHFAMRHPVHV